MRWRTLVILLVLVVGLGSFIWFFERDLPSTGERARLSNKLLRLDPDTVRAVALESGERETRLERSSSGEWALTVPRTDRADETRVRDFLERIQELELKRTLETGSRNDFGLQLPRAVIELETESESISLRFGGAIPASSNTIVEVGNGPPFYVVEDGLLDDIDRAVDDWRSRDAIPLAISQINRIEVSSPSANLTLSRSGERFLLTEPVEDLADAAKVTELLAALTDLEIEDFLDGEEADLDRGLFTLTLATSEREAPLVVEVGATQEASGGAVRIRAGGRTFTAETDLPSLLESSSSAWRSGRWADRDVFEAQSVRLVVGGRESSYQRRDGVWWRGDAEIEYSIVSAFLRAVSAARGTVVDDAPSALEGLPRLEVELESSAGTESLRLWATAEGDLAQREGRSAVVRLNSDSVDQVLAKLEDLESAPEDASDSE